jgi:predicted kinase
VKQEQARTVYLLSGPAGVGKSTTSMELVNSLPDGAYLSGDVISHMHRNGREKPWESKREHDLIWQNILLLTRNFVRYGSDVVIDYIIFPKDAEWVRNQLRDLGVTIKYTVLWADKDTLVKRDAMRIEEERMGDRCLVLFDEFIHSGLNHNQLLHTSLLTPHDIQHVVREIKTDNRFIHI